MGSITIVLLAEDSTTVSDEFYPYLYPDEPHRRERGWPPCQTTIRCFPFAKKMHDR